MSPSTGIYPVEQMIRFMMQGRVLAFYEYMSRESARDVRSSILLLYRGFHL